MSDLEQQTENEEPKTEERLTSIKNENFLPTVTEENENIDSSEAEKAETATLEMKAEEDGSSAPMMKSQEKKEEASTTEIKIEEDSSSVPMKKSQEKNEQASATKVKVEEEGSNNTALSVATETLVDDKDKAPGGIN